MNKQAQIDAWDARPIQEGDLVTVLITYQETEYVTTGRGKSKKTEPLIKNVKFSHNGTVVKVFETTQGKLFAVNLFSKSLPSKFDEIRVPGYEKNYDTSICKEEWVKRTYGLCGADPFKKEPPRVNFYNKQINSILSDCGYARRGLSYDEMEVTTIIDKGHASERHLIGKTYGGCNFNPYVLDKDGNKQYFQRGLVWTTEQKQQLIESMYNWIEIGKIVFRYRSWEQLSIEMVDSGHGYNWECIDGKQRLNAILEFIQGKFADLHGNYWKDLSPNAQNHILNYDRIAFAKLEEHTSDADVIRVFLTLNFTGVPMSIDHIKFVQSINV